jgi:predicted  nucleic acid-binding Zn-ribbon protein
VRGQLNRARDLEDDYAIDQGKKLAELQHKKQSLEQQKKNIETGLQNIRQKRQEVGEIRGSNQDSPQKFPPSAYTFKPRTI